MSETEMKDELIALRKENRELQQALQQTRTELRAWEHNAILLSPEEIFAFSRQYRERQAKERKERDEAAIAEIDKLMASIVHLKGVKNDDERV